MTTFPVSSLEKNYRMLVYPDRYVFTVPLQYIKIDNKDIHKVLVENDNIVIIVSKLPSNNETISNKLC